MYRDDAVQKRANNMGFSSFSTNDTNESISNQWSIRGALPVFMSIPKQSQLAIALRKSSFFEKSYDGYGVFDGLDFFTATYFLNSDLSYREIRKLFIRNERGANCLEDYRCEGIDLFYDNDNAITPLFSRTKSDYESFGETRAINCSEQGYFYDN